MIWEGVVPYLTEAAVRATATRLATGLDPRSLVAFDFVGKKFADGRRTSRDKDQQTRAYVGELGEPIRYGSDDIAAAALRVRLPLGALARLQRARARDAR